MNSQQIIIAEPPNIEAIDRAFHTRGRAIVYAWGEKIYNPTGVVIEPQILAHEAVHGYRQLQRAVQDDDESILVWWDRYINEAPFRLQEEVLAHRAEFVALAARTSDRNAKNRYMLHVAAKLAAPLYGHITTQRHARRLLKGTRA